MKIRSRDPQFLAAAERYIRKVGEIAAPLEVAKGGPILMVQVENEYGSYGNDHEYTGAVLKMLRNAGFDGTLYTADGPRTRCSLAARCQAFWRPSTSARATIRRRSSPISPSSGRACPRWWASSGRAGSITGARTTTNGSSQGSEESGLLLSRGIGVNLYMAHGGTSFGPMAGANLDDRYEPDISSYDYDAPIDEAGG